MDNPSYRIQFFLSVLKIIFEEFFFKKATKNQRIKKGELNII